MQPAGPQRRRRTDCIRRLLQRMWSCRSMQFLWRAHPTLGAPDRLMSLLMTWAGLKKTSLPLCRMLALPSVRTVKPSGTAGLLRGSQHDGIMQNLLAAAPSAQQRPTRSRRRRRQLSALVVSAAEAMRYAPVQSRHPFCVWRRQQGSWGSLAAGLHSRHSRDVGRRLNARPGPAKRRYPLAESEYVGASVSADANVRAHARGLPGPGLPVKGLHTQKCMHAQMESPGGVGKLAAWRRRSATVCSC